MLAVDAADRAQPALDVLAQVRDRLASQIARREHAVLRVRADIDRRELGERDLAVAVGVGEELEPEVRERLALRLSTTTNPALAAQPRKLSKKTINNCLTVLHRALSMARMRGLIAACPHFEWFKIPPAKFDFLTFEEADRLLQAATGEERTMILVALRTGLRFGELVALRWEDVDLVAGKVMVRRRLYRGKFDTPKSGKPREVPLSEDAQVALKQHRHLRGELVFCDLDGRPFSHRVATNALWRCLKRAGLRSMGWHALRHTFASQLAMAGAPLKAIQELLGHANIQMTMRYAHLAPEIARDSVQLLDRRSSFGGRGSVVAATS